MVYKKIERVPKNYQGLQPTGRQIKDLLGPILSQMDQLADDKPHELIEAWPELVGEKIASMTQAVSYSKGTFLVKVNNATLYSLLVQHEKHRLLQLIQERFLHLQVRNLLFRMG
jgi:hypothetical protein